jgi:uncharacterized protein (DUF4415 family)
MRVVAGRWQSLVVAQSLAEQTFSSTSPQRNQRLPGPEDLQGSRDSVRALMRPEYDFSKGKRGAVVPQKGKTRISIFTDNAVLDAFRTRAEKAGSGYQTMMNEALRQYLAEADQPVTEKVLRQVLRQELPEYVAGVTARSKTKSKF